MSCMRIQTDVKRNTLPCEKVFISQSELQCASMVEMILLCASMLALCFCHREQQKAWTMKHWRLVCGQNGATDPRELLSIKLLPPMRLKTGGRRCQQNDCKHVCACVYACVGVSVLCIYCGGPAVCCPCAFVGGPGPSCRADLSERDTFMCECVRVYSICVYVVQKK